MNTRKMHRSQSRSWVSIFPAQDSPANTATVQRNGYHPRYGFSLLELQIVITVILILAALAIPHFMRARAAANTAAAAATVRTIQTAEVLYSVTYNQGFSSSLKSLGGRPGETAGADSAGLIDELLAGGEKSGYTYIYIPGPVEDGKIRDYEIVAIPAQPCISGLHTYVTSASRGSSAAEIQNPNQAFGSSLVFAMTGSADCGVE